MRSSASDRELCDRPMVDCTAVSPVTAEPTSFVAEASTACPAAELKFEPPNSFTIV